MRYIRSILAAALFASPAMAGLIDTVNSGGSDPVTVDATIGAGEYAGTVTGGGTGFGGPVGNGQLSVGRTSTGVAFGFANMGDISGNSIRVYFDTVAGGYTELSAAAGFNETSDFGRSRVSRVASEGLTLPFAADYGWIISPAFGGFQALFQLVPGGDNSLVYTGDGITADPIGESPSHATYEFVIPYADLGITSADNVDFVVVYGNNNDPSSAFMSNEGFPFQGSSSNFGNGPVTISNFDRIAVPEPASLGLIGLLAACGLGRRRKV
jgi:hypothetical protein